MEQSRSATLAAAKTLLPYAQGDLDSLCGTYSIMNAVRLAMHEVAPMSATQVTRLFGVAISWLDENARLNGAMRHGLGQRQWRALVQNVIAHAPRSDKRVLRLSPLPRWWSASDEEIFEWLLTQMNGQRPVLMLINESYRHYTVISGISDARITLFDSYGYRWLSRQACSFRRQLPPARHRLSPKSLLALSWEAA